MSANEIMELIRKEPEEVVMALGELLDDLRADLVDQKLGEAVMAGKFDDLAAIALTEHAEGKTIPLHEFLHQR